MSADHPLILHVRLTPGASRNAIQGWADDSEGRRVLKVSVTAIPENGKANDAMIRLMAKEFRLPKSAFTLKSGATDRNKTLHVQGMTPDHLSRI